MLKLIAVLIVLVEQAFGGCITHSCDNTIRYAMDRYSDKTLLRLQQFRRTISAMKESEELLLKVEKRQSLELDRLLKRSVLENIYIKGITHTTSTKKSMSAGYNNKKEQQ